MTAKAAKAAARHAANGKAVKNVLVIDIGGTHVKVFGTAQGVQREFESGPSLTPKRMLSEVRKLVADCRSSGC